MKADIINVFFLNPKLSLQTEIESMTSNTNFISKWQIIICTVFGLRTVWLLSNDILNVRLTRVGTVYWPNHCPSDLLIDNIEHFRVDHAKFKDHFFMISTRLTQFSYRIDVFVLLTNEKFHQTLMKMKWNKDVVPWIARNHMNTKHKVIWQ